MSVEVSGAQEGEQFCPACEKSFPLDVSFCPDDKTDLVRLFTPKDPMLGRKLGQRFLIESKLGVGGMGTVYLGTQLSIGRKVAVKVIDKQRSGETMIAKRFLREAKLSSRLSQANTVSIFDFGQDDDGTLFLAMELIKGKELADVIKSEGAFIPKRVKNIGVQLCDALEAAHKLSIIHRDLKPGNIMMLDDPPGRDVLKVLDFGLAKSLIGEAESVAVTQSGIAMGTPLYISPEAVSGKTGDTRTDLYSVGIILYELLAGTPPFVSQNTNELFYMHMSTRPPDFSSKVPKSLAEVVLRLLEKDPDARYSSAAETRQALLAAFGEAPEPVTHVELQPAGKVEAAVSGRNDGGKFEVAPTLLAEAPSPSPIGAQDPETTQVPSVESATLAMPSPTPSATPTPTPSATPTPTPSPTSSSPALAVSDPVSTAALDAAPRGPSRLVAAVGISAALGLGVYVASLQFSGNSSSEPDGKAQALPDELTPSPERTSVGQGAPVEVDAGQKERAATAPPDAAADSIAENTPEVKKIRKNTKQTDRHKKNERKTKPGEDKKPPEEKKPGLEPIGHQLPP